VEGTVAILHEVREGKSETHERQNKHGRNESGKTKRGKLPEGITLS